MCSYEFLDLLECVPVLSPVAPRFLLYYIFVIRIQSNILSSWFLTNTQCIKWAKQRPFDVDLIYIKRYLHVSLHERLQAYKLATLIQLIPPIAYC